MSVDIKILGLKSLYNFKGTHIPTSREKHDIHQKLKQILTPTIRELESRKLINGFHYLIHKNIDIRLSCDDWDQHESSIKEIITNHSIPADLIDWTMPTENYGGEIGVDLCYNNLEFNSRLSLALIEFMYEMHIPVTSTTHSGKLLPPIPVTSTSIKSEQSNDKKILLLKEQYSQTIY